MAATIAKNSTRSLAWLFIISLPVFILLRWDYSSWLSAQIQQVAKSNGININFDAISLSGLGLHFDNLRISRANIKEIRCESLDVSLAVSTLLSGKLGASIAMIWETNPLSFTAVQQEQLIELSNISATIDLAQLDQYLQRLPAKLSGKIEATGALSLNPVSQQLQTGSLDIAWTQAMAGLTQPEFILGDYIFHLGSSEEANQPWTWSIRGGPGLTLEGGGALSPQNPDPKQWSMSGEVAVTADQSNPTLAMMIQTVAGSNPARLRLSGTLFNLKKDIIR